MPSRPQLLLDHRLGRDPGVVGAEDPERVAPAHPVDPGQRVLDRAVERVAHVQRAGHVRRRDRDREVVLGGALRGRIEGAARLPGGEDPPLDLGRIPARRRLELRRSVAVHRSGDVRGVLRPLGRVADPVARARAEARRAVAGGSPAVQRSSDEAAAGRCTRSGRVAGARARRSGRRSARSRCPRAGTSRRRVGAWSPGSFASSSPISPSESPIRCAKTMNAIRRSTAPASTAGRPEPARSERIRPRSS